MSVMASNDSGVVVDGTQVSAKYLNTCLYLHRTKEELVHLLGTGFISLFYVR